MKAYTHLFMLLLAVLALVGCQQNGYTIEGTTQGIVDGDTLLLTRDLDTGIPSDTIVVSDGHFSLSGQVDSVVLCAIYSPEGLASATFFLEPGTIEVSLNADDPDLTTVGGTKANDGWQQLTVITHDYGLRIDSIYQLVSGQIYAPGAEREYLDSQMAKVDSLQTLMVAGVLQVAREHIADELGYFIVTNFAEEPKFTREKRRELIDAMPQHFQQRPAVRELLRLLDANTEDATAEGKTMPVFTLTTPEGDEAPIADLIGRNRITILDFWASWCKPCLQEVPTMLAIYKKFQPKGLGIVGISLDEDHEAWTKAIRDHGMPWPQMSDLKGWQNQAAQLFQVTSIPFFVVVDAQGTILSKGLRGQELEQFIAEKIED